MCEKTMSIGHGECKMEIENIFIWIVRNQLKDKNKIGWKNVALEKQYS